MVKTLEVAYQQSQNLTQIWGTYLSGKNPLKNRFLSISCTRFLSSIFIKNPNKINVNKNVLHVRGFASISTAPLPVIPHSHNIIRKSRDCLRFPSLPLLPLRRSCSSSLHFSVMSQNNDHGNTAPPQESTKSVRCVIKGRVQGVFYRNWTVENATQLGLKGWVRNRRDGSVEALFSGKSETVDEMLQRCRRGPPDAMVTAFEACPINEDPGEGFERRPTV